MDARSVSMKVRSGVAFVALVFLMGFGVVPQAEAVPAAVTPGTQLWVARTTSFQSYDEARAVAVSPNGSRVFVTGQAGDGHNASVYQTAAYNASTGKTIWSSWYFGGDNVYGPASWATSIAVSPDSTKVYVTGTSLGSDESWWDFGTVAYDAATGRQLWEALYDANSNDYATALAVSADGSRVFVTGTTDKDAAPFDADVALVAYDSSSGAQLWARTYDDAAHGYDVSYAIAAGPNGSRVFVTGGGGGASSDYLTLAYDAVSGSRLWASTYDGAAQASDTAIGIAISPNASRVFVTGSSDGASATVAYRAAAGTRAWVARYDGPTHAGATTSWVAPSPAGSRLFLAGTSENASVAIGLNSVTGARVWVARYDGPTHAGAGAVGLGVSPDGSKVYVTGTPAGGTGLSFFATVAYGAARGAHLWTARYTGLGKGAQAVGIAVGPGGSKVFVTGSLKSGTFYTEGVPIADMDFATVAYAT